MSSLGSAISGSRYQAGAFWYHASTLLFDESVEFVELESIETKVIDDVVCHYTRPRPIDGTDLTYLADYFQIKYHVDMSNALSHAYLIDETAVSTKKSILERFYVAFQKLSDRGNSRLNLVTNWSWDHNDPLSETVRRGHFNTGYIKTKDAREAVRGWIKKLGCTPEQFEEFANRLVFRNRSFDLFEQREALSDRLFRAGLIPLDLEVQHGPYDDLGLRLIEAGKTKIDRDFLTEFAKTNKVYNGPPQKTNSSNILAIRSFDKVFDSVAPAFEVNLNHLFEGSRKIRSDRDWTRDIFGELEKSLNARALSKLSNPTECHLDCHLSIAFAAGRLLSPKKGYEVDLRQRVRGASEIWTSKTTAGEDPKVASAFNGAHSSRDLVISVSVSRPIDDDVSKTAQATLSGFDFLSIASPVVGQTSVRDGAAAWSLADAIVDAVYNHIRQFKERPNLHLFLACPAGLAFRIGQASQILGSLKLYEFDFEGTHKYTPSITMP